MKNTKYLLDLYYEGLSNQVGWEETIADSFEYKGDEISLTSIGGKEDYINIIRNFLERVNNIQIKEMIIEDEKACVIITYKLLLPTGKLVRRNVCEIWTIKNHKLQSLIIYFNTMIF